MPDYDPPIPEQDPCGRCQGSGQELTVSDVEAAGDASGEPMPDPQELARIGEQRRKKRLYDASLRGLESEEQQTRDLQDKLETGEPMDIAFRLLKEDDWDPRDYFSDVDTNPEKYAGKTHEQVKAMWEEAQAKMEAIDYAIYEHKRVVKEREDREREEREAEAERKRLYAETRPVVNPIKARMKELEGEHGLGSIEAVLDEERNRIIQAEIEERGQPKMIGSMPRDDIARIGGNWENITPEDRQRLAPRLPDHVHQAAEEHQANREMIKDLMREGHITQNELSGPVSYALWAEVQNEDSDIGTGEPMDLAWRLLKTPVMDTDVPGVRMAYGSDKPVRHLQRKDRLVGSSPVGEPYEVQHMTPNEFFDTLHTAFTSGGSDATRMAAAEMELQAPPSDEPVPHEPVDHSNVAAIDDFHTLSLEQALARMRWKDMDTENPPIHGVGKVGDTMNAFRREGFFGDKPKKVMGMPSLQIKDGEATGIHDGGHRMEALRQMGHGDTPVPVYVTKPQTKRDQMNLIYALNR